MLKFRELISRWTIYWVLTGILAGGVVHIITVLMLPHVAASRAWHRISALYPANVVQVLPPAAPDDMPLPLMAPDVRYAICRFDLRQSSVTFTTEMLGASWSIALYSPLGLNDYTIGGGDLQQPELSMILTRAKDEASAASIAEGAKAGTLTVPVKDVEGILVMRAPVESPSYLPMVEGAMSHTTCAATPEQ